MEVGLCKNCAFYKMPMDGFGGCGNPIVVGSNHVNTWISPDNPVPETPPQAYVAGYDWDGVCFDENFGCIHFVSK